MLFVGKSCTQLEETGTLQFGLELSESTELKSAVSDPNVSIALVSIAGKNGDLIYDKEPLPIYKFGSEYTTISLKIRVGEFMLTEFMLIDSSGVVLWATPKAGSNLAHLVRNPLPNHFIISPERTTSLGVEVIRVGYHPPADFGYVNFDIGFVDRFCLQVFYSSRCIDNWNDSILGPDGTTAPIYMPRLMIWAGNRKLIDEPLNQGLGKYAIPMGFEWYHLLASDCRGQTFYEQKFHRRELLEHRCSPGHRPLIIYHDADSGIIITPEGLNEPTIEQGVFGSVTIPAETDNDTTNEYDVWPVVRDIYFYPYALMDSIRTFAPMGCYFPIESFTTKPLAIVRSNTDGYFQAHLETGDYLYLVKEQKGYYFDAYISSHLPGFVTVFPGEVTKLYIHIIDCSMWM